MVSSLQKAPTSDSDSERTLYDCPDRTSQADQADSRHDSRSEIFFPYAPPFFSIISALTSSTQQPQVASLQPIEETKWQRPLVLPTLNAHRRLVSLIIALTFLSGGLVAGWIAFVIHQNHILLGEESPDNEGKDDDQELNPLILLIDAVFIIFIMSSISIVLWLIYRLSTQFRPPSSPSSTIHTAHPLDFLPEWCRTSLPSLPTYSDAVAGASSTTRHGLDMGLSADENNRISSVLTRNQNYEEGEDRSGNGVPGAMTHDEDIERQMRAREQGLMSYGMSEQLQATTQLQRQIQFQPQSFALEVTVENEPVTVNMEDIKMRRRIETEEGGGKGDEEKEKNDEIEVRLGV
ncbi:hypothetical protein CNBG_3662 [Cryptococcus deuterogattii R265]|uniref:Uncharacterized protein n=1 Tax=Cryptococcus deuterogattii (strain R265) TaxID=294750 RepID=A0A095CEB1_CRYD2|nr:hypothetical protein CNBG_3662 [Cryptococcus deuterogattii R265]KIR69741.1 hypothetical protein I310_06465 [Cryptococcus deuterogattii CA1014]